MLHSTILPNEYMVLIWNSDSSKHANEDASRLGLKKVTIFGGNSPLNETLRKILLQRN